MKKKNVKPILKSNTTQAIAVSGGSVIGMLAFVRSMFPELLPWGPELDAMVAAFGAGTIVPIVSRLIAKFRG